MSACYLCGFEDHRVILSVDEWQILGCPVCDLRWLHPQPDPSSLSELYDEDYFTRNRIMTADTDEQLKRKVADQGSWIRFISRYKSAGTILDVGCASGFLLARAREVGYEVRGLEVSEWAVEQGRERMGLDISKGTVESADFEPATFDIITMLHVVEHMEDPIKSLAKVGGWLKPDGLLVLACPNAGSFDAARYRAEWAGWRIPYHLWHFTPRSLSAILGRSGYEVTDVKTAHSQWIKEKVRRIPIVSLARNIVSACFSGRDMRLVARPMSGCART